MWQEIFDLLGDLSFFAAAWKTDKVEVRATWSLVKSAGRLEPINAYRSVLAEPETHDVFALWRLALYLQYSGYGAETLTLWSYLIEYFRASREDADLQGCLGNQAVILRDTGDLDGAMRLLKEQEAICRRLNDPARLAGSLANQARLLAFSLSRPEDGLPLVEEAARIATKHGLLALARQIEPNVNAIRDLVHPPPP